MTSLELDLFLAVPSSEFNTYWIPCTWFINLLKEARQNRRIPDPQGLKLVMEEFSEFRTKCGLLWSFDWICIPLVYTQVVTLATYSFFAVALVARQYIDGNEKQFQLEIDTYVPIFTILQFFFFMGLLKVAEQLINPFGDDDEDFELNWIIDRHTKVSYLGVDTLMNRCPPLVKDIYFDDENLILPYTEAAAAYKKKTYRGSVAKMTVPEEKQTMFLPDIEEDDEDLKPSLHTSNMSLATHADSPSCERRQISLPAETPTNTDQNSPETVLQFDIQETPPDQRSSTITEAVMKFSHLGKYSTQRIDQNRKPFFTLTKSPKVILEPWPSATNLSSPARHFIDTPLVYSGDANPWKEYTHRVWHRPSLDQLTPDQLLEVEEHRDFEDVQMPGTFSASTSDSPRSDTCHCHCRHTGTHYLKPPEANLPVTEKVTLKRGSPKFLVRRHKSMGTTQKKGVQWKQTMNAHRSKTIDDESPTEEIFPQTRSSPNLKHLDDNNAEDTEADVFDDETSSAKKE